jgi:hypothetical protein
MLFCFLLSSENGAVGAVFSGNSLGSGLVKVEEFGCPVNRKTFLEDHLNEAFSDLDINESTW